MRQELVHSKAELIAALEPLRTATDDQLPVEITLWRDSGVTTMRFGKDWGTELLQWSKHGKHLRRWEPFATMTLTPVPAGLVSHQRDKRARQIIATVRRTSNKDLFS